MRKLILISALLAASTSFRPGRRDPQPQPRRRGRDRTGKADRPGLDAARPGGHRSDRDHGSGPGPGARCDDRDHQAEPKAETKTTETKPAKPAKKVRREGDEAKARRIAAKYGVYW